MRIVWDFDGDVTKLAMKRDDETGDKIATVTLCMLLDRATSERVFGESFVKLVFDSRSSAAAVACKQWKLLGVFEAHVARFAHLHQAVETVPEFDKVEPAGAEHVRLFLKLPFVVGMTVVKAVVESFGEGIAVSLAPQQEALGLGSVQ